MNDEYSLLEESDYQAQDDLLLLEEQFYFEKDLAKIKHYMKTAKHFNAIRKMSYEIQDILKLDNRFYYTRRDLGDDACFKFYLGYTCIFQTHVKYFYEESFFSKDKSVCIERLYQEAFNRFKDDFLSNDSIKDIKNVKFA
jgi:hypothetical protein